MSDSSSRVRAELVCFWVRKPGPAAWLQAAPVIDHGRAQRQESLQLLALVLRHGHDVKMDAILPLLAFWHSHEHKPRPTLVRRTRDPIRVAGRGHLLHRISGDRAPKSCHDFRVMAVKRHIQDRRIHHALSTSLFIYLGLEDEKSLGRQLLPLEIHRELRKSGPNCFPEPVAMYPHRTTSAPV